MSCPPSPAGLFLFTDHGGNNNNNDNTAATFCGGGGGGGVSSELGTAYERTIMLGLVRDRNDWCYWEIHLVVTSRDGSWLTSLSRDEAASFVSLDSIIR